MASLNKVQLIGNLGRDPETRFLGNGTAVCNFSVATTDTWKDKQTGEKKEKTEWHNVVLYAKTAEIAAKWLKKGSSVYIEGHLQTRKWTDKAGVERYSTEVVGEEMKMLGGRPRQEESQDDGYAVPPARVDRPAPNFGDMDDDIPF